LTKEKIESGLVKILENSDSLVSMPKEMLTTLKGINNGKGSLSFATTTITLNPMIIARSRAAIIP